MLIGAGSPMAWTRPATAGLFRSADGAPFSPNASDARRQGAPLDNAAAGRAGETAQRDGKTPVGRKQECATCENRTYQDGSNDPGVSFKTPSKIGAGQEAGAVLRHEREHVVRNQAKALRENREIVSQTVTLHNGVCPECGRVYVSGGTTRTATRARPEDRFRVGLEENPSGHRLDSVA